MTQADLTVIRPRAGVAMCVFNGARHLLAQLESIAGQTELPCCMAVVDDGSTDGSWELLQHWASSAPFPMELQRNETGLGVIRNFEKAVRLVLPKADVVFLSDQDDEWFPGKLAAFVDCFAADPALGLVHSDADLVDGEGRPIGRRLFDALLVKDRERSDVAAGRAYRSYLQRNLVTGAACACRGDVLARALPFSRNIIHDEWIAFTASIVSRVRLLEQPWMAYRLHQGNTIGLPLPDLGWRVRGFLRALGPVQRDIQARRAVRLQEMHGHATALGAAPEVMACIASAVDHARHRAGLPLQFLTRAAAVRSQWRAGHYREWSGRLAAVRDLFST